MTVSHQPEGEAAVLGALLEARVQFVVVGEADDGEVLRLVVWRHPTNLDALGKVLARMGAALHAAGGRETARDADAGTGAEGVRRIGDPFGTVTVTARGVDLDLMFGGLHHSLYVETLAAASDRVIAGLQVKWASAPARITRRSLGTGGALGRRLLSIAEGIVHLVEREEEGPAASGDSDD